MTGRREGDGLLHHSIKDKQMRERREERERGRDRGVTQTVRILTEYRLISDKEIWMQRKSSKFVV